MKNAGPIPFNLSSFLSALKRPYASPRLSFPFRMHRATFSHSPLLVLQRSLQCSARIPPQAIAAAQTLSTFTPLESAASAKTSLRLGLHFGTFAASASERTSVNDAPFFMPGSSGSRQSSRLLRNSSRGSGRNLIDGRSILDSLQVSTLFGSSLAVLVGGRRSTEVFADSVSHGTPGRASARAAPAVEEDKLNRLISQPYGPPSRVGLAPIWWCPWASLVLLHSAVHGPAPSNGTDWEADVNAWWCVRYGDALAWIEAQTEAAAVRRWLDLHRLGAWTDDARDGVVLGPSADAA